MSYDYDHKNNKILINREFAKFDRGYPDGSTVDSEGFLWSCRWSGSCVVRFDPNGNLILSLNYLFQMLQVVLLEDLI